MVLAVAVQVQVVPKDQATLAKVAAATARKDIRKGTPYHLDIHLFDLIEFFEKTLF